MATYTDNNNAIALASIQGIQGSTGSGGPAGVTGPTGLAGSQGPSGVDGYIGTDICFSGENSDYRIISKESLELVGAFIFEEQADITSVKVLAGALTDSGEPAEVGFFLHADTPATNGNTLLASMVTTLAGTGMDKDSEIITLTLSGYTFANQSEPTFLWAYIKPTTGFQGSTLNRLTTDGYTGAEVIKYKEQTYEIPYEYDTDSVYNRLVSDYNTKSSSISGKKQTALDLVKKNREAAAEAAPATPTSGSEPEGNELHVKFLKIT